MKGKNVLKMNIATMEQGVQYYLNQEVYQEDITVTAVRWNHSESVFEIDFQTTKEMENADKTS